MLKHIFFPLLLCFACLTARAQFTEYPSQMYAYSHLLVEDTVWVATGNGVFKMLRNGQMLRRYPLTGSGLTLEPPSDMCIDAQGRLLVNHGLSGITRLDGATWTRITTENMPIIGNKDLTEMEVDAQGHIWLASNIDSVYRFDGQDWAVVQTPFSPNSVFQLRRGPDGAMWVAGLHGVARFDGNAWATSLAALPGRTFFTDLTWDIEGNLYTVCNGNDEAKDIWKFEDSELSNPILVANTAFLGNFPQNYGSICVDAAGRVWLGCSFYNGLAGNGLIRWDGSTWAEFRSSNSPLLDERHLEQITADPDGSVWVNNNERWTSNQPLFRIQNDEWSVFSAGFEAMNSCGLADDNGRIWFGGSELIGYYEPQTKQYRHFQPKNTHTSGNSFYDMALAPDSSIWAVSNLGLWRFDGAVWQAIPNDFGGSQIMFKVVVDAEQNVWTVAYGVAGDSELRVFHPASNQWELIPNPNEPGQYWHIRDIAAAPDSSIWLGLIGGITRFKNGAQTDYNENTLGYPFASDANRVMNLAMAPDGKLWAFVINRGLVSFDGMEWSVLAPSTGGLYNATNLANFVVAADNSLWATFTDGLNSFQILQHFTGQTWTNYTDDNSNLGHRPSVLILPAPNGSVWLHDAVEFYSFKNLPRWLRGQVRRDDNADCLPEPSETPLDQWVVQATDPDGTAFYGKTYANGLYEINLDSSVYQVSLLPPSMVWDDCDADLSTDLTTVLADTADFSGEIVADCPLLALDVSVPFLRRCFTTTYQINWCNLGTADAMGANVQLYIPTQLQVQSMSLPFMALGSGVYSINIGNVAVGGCGGFSMSVLVDCNAELGSTLCVSAHITPDTICLASPNWSGADLVASARCAGDTVVFSLKNKGNGNMQQSLDYIVIEDEVIMRSAPILLPAGDSMLVAFPVSSGYQRIQGPQELGHPFPGLVSASVEGCNGQGTEGFSLQYPFDDPSPFNERECAEVVGSFDPNDKAALPKGVKNEHFILPGTAIDYKIRFQNTGTDTAFTVVVRDTLSPWLDVATLRPGAASHPYNWDLTGAGVLTFTFEHILLPDSNVNQAASNGFIAFNIKPLDSIPLGTLVENWAGIYFDFNEAVITNTVWHTVDTGFLQSNIPLVLVDEKSVPLLSVFPNPAKDMVRIYLNNHVLQKIHGLKNPTLRMSNALGQVVWVEKFAGQQVRVQRKGLAGGVCFVEIVEGARVVAVGKVMWE